jgi:tetrahydrodipicolinate N-succinyltransferase
MTLDPTANVLGGGAVLGGRVAFGIEGDVVGDDCVVVGDDCVVVGDDCVVVAAVVMDVVAAATVAGMCSPSVFGRTPAVSSVCAIDFALTFSLSSSVILSNPPSSSTLNAEG